MNHMGFIIRVWWRRSLSSHICCLTDLGRFDGFFSRESFVESFRFQLTLYVLSTFQSLSTWIWVAKVNLYSRRRLSLLLFDRPSSFPPLFEIEGDPWLWARTPRLVSFRRLLVRLFRSFFRWHHSHSLSFFFGFNWFFLACWFPRSLRFSLALIAFSCHHQQLNVVAVPLLCKGVIALLIGFAGKTAPRKRKEGSKNRVIFDDIPLKTVIIGLDKMAAIENDRRRAFRQIFFKFELDFVCENRWWFKCGDCSFHFLYAD